MVIGDVVGVRCDGTSSVPQPADLFFGEHAQAADQNTPMEFRLFPLSKKLAKKICSRLKNIAALKKMAS